MFIRDQTEKKTTPNFFVGKNNTERLASPSASWEPNWGHPPENNRIVTVLTYLRGLRGALN